MCTICRFTYVRVVLQIVFLNGIKNERKMKQTQKCVSDNKSAKHAHIQAQDKPEQLPQHTIQNNLAQT